MYENKQKWFRISKPKTDHKKNIRSMRPCSILFYYYLESYSYRWPQVKMIILLSLWNMYCTFYNEGFLMLVKKKSYNVYRNLQFLSSLLCFNLHNITGGNLICSQRQELNCGFQNIILMNEWVPYVKLIYKLIDSKHSTHSTTLNFSLRDRFTCITQTWFRHF